jgi:hypothetical protein
MCVFFSCFRVYKNVGITLPLLSLPSFSSCALSASALCRFIRISFIRFNLASAALDASLMPGSLKLVANDTDLSDLRDGADTDSRGAAALGSVRGLLDDVAAGGAVAVLAAEAADTDLVAPISVA